MLLDRIKIEIRIICRFVMLVAALGQQDTNKRNYMRNNTVVHVGIGVTE